MSRTFILQMSDYFARNVTERLHFVIIASIMRCFVLDEECRSGRRSLTTGRVKRICHQQLDTARYTYGSGFLKFVLHALP